MTSPFQIRQSNTPKPQGVFSRSIDLNSGKVNKSNTLELASYDSTRTDLSVNSRDVIIGEQWVVLGRIGEGSFGEVFEVEDIDTFKRYAIKREPLKMRHPQLKHESIVYDALAGGPGIPQCYWHGQHEGFDCIVIDLLGPNLNQLKEVVQSFPIETVVDFGVQMITILEHFHNRGLVYRDMKPDNFLFSSQCQLPEPEMIETPDDHGMPHIKYVYPTCQEVFRKWNEPNPKLYVVDYGLVSWWRNPETNQPYPEAKRNIKNKTGTARYASLNVHRGKPHARRDDIEGLGYLLLDLIFGTLPWSGIQARNSRAGWDKMRQIKEDTFMSDLCAGLPKGLLEFVEYSRKIRFAEEPNYNLLRQFLQESVHGGVYSTIVKSPFGGHTERKWVQDIDKDSSPRTREDMPRPNTNMQDEPYYRQPTTPRQRRTSYHTHRTEDKGVFDMDDLNNHLPNVHQQPHSRPKSVGVNIDSNRRASKEYGHAHGSATATTGPSSYKKLVMKNRKKQKRVGWNSHKHDEAPWIPETDWNTNPVVQPEFEVKRNSWGEDLVENTWGIPEEEKSWAANVVKPWD